MSLTFAFAKRNCTKFFRERSAIASAFIGVLIVLMLYVMFLKDLMIASYPDVGGEYLMDSWVMGGIIAVASITSALGSYGILISDRTEGTSKLLKTSPMTSLEMSFGYILSSFIISFILGMIMLGFAEVYIVAYGGHALSALNFLKVIGIMLIGIASNSALMFFIVTFLKTNNAFTTVCVIIGTLVGFLAGAYIPLGNFPSGVQSFLSFMPVTHQASLLRQSFMSDPETMYFSDVPADVLHQFQIDMGEILTFNGSDISTIVSVLFIIGTAIIFTVLSAWNLRRMN